MSRLEHGHCKALICGCTLSWLACAIDSRPGNLATMASGNDDSGATSSVSAAGSGNQLPDASVPGGSISNASGAGGATPGDGTPNPALPLNGGGAPGSAAAGGATLLMGSSGSGPDSSSAAGAGNTNPGPSEVVGGCFNQLFANAGFDRGHTGWTEISEAVHDVIVRGDDALAAQAGVTPQSGDYLAWIGGIPNSEFRMYRSTLQQEVAVPAETLSLTLSGYYWVSQRELGKMPFDWAVLEAEDHNPNGTGLWQVELFDDRAVTNGWVHFEVTTLDVANLAGRTVTFRADSRPNGDGTLSVWLDSLRLEARCPR